MSILLLDNYDSFTFNLVHRMAEVRPGLAITVVRNDELSLEEIAAAAPSHIVISPGPCGPAEAGVCVDAVRRFAGRVPILGVCLGHQCIAAAFGMAVVRAPAPYHGKPSVIHHDGGTLFAGIASPLTAMRYHSLIADEAALPPPDASGSWEVSAWTSETNGGPASAVVASPAASPARIIMALRRRWAAAHPHRAPLEGVQFHPESFMTPTGHQLLANFLSTRVSDER